MNFEPGDHLIQSWEGGKKPRLDTNISFLAAKSIINKNARDGY